MKAFAVLGSLTTRESEADNHISDGIMFKWFRATVHDGQILARFQESFSRHGKAFHCLRR